MMSQVSVPSLRAARDHNAARLRLLAVIPRAARAPRVGDAVVALAGRLVGVGKGAGEGLAYALPVARLPHPCASYPRPLPFPARRRWPPRLPCPCPGCLGCGRRCCVCPGVRLPSPDSSPGPLRRRAPAGAEPRDGSAAAARGGGGRCCAPAGGGGGGAEGGAAMGGRWWG